MEAVLAALSVDALTGLTESRVTENRTSFGSNEVEAIRPASARSLILEGIRQPMMVLLLSIAVLSVLFGRIVEALVMLFVVVAYIGVEFANKRRSDRTLVQLRRLTAPSTRVLRDGHIQEIATRDIVVGDILILSEGSRIPVDARLIEAFGLTVNEASLTGESAPQQKKAGVVLAADTPVAERVNSVFSGTTVVSGEGKALVLAVGGTSELGKITTAVSGAQRGGTLLQAAMTQLAKVLAIVALAVSALIPLIGFLQGLSLQDMIITWLSLTFLMIPGQPPIIITMALALASFELAKDNVVVKRLRGAETLGQITALVTDKTGTLTENRMRVSAIILPDGREIVPKDIPPDVRRVMALAVPQYSTDPTDVAVAEVLGGAETPAGGGRLSTFKGFTEDAPWRAITYENESKTMRAIAGSPEQLIGASKLPPEQEDKLRHAVVAQARMGKRVVAYASDNQKGDTLAGAHLAALAVLEDPVRPGAKQALKELHDAGVVTYIVTGDHPVTTSAVAHQVGLETEAFSGAGLDGLSDAEITETLSTRHVFARITPSQKLRLVEALKARGEVVAVIGDGMNDAPALSSADAGIAMGQIGTDLAKEAADLILTDDNYVHIPRAVEVGRKALDNFRKGLTYYLSAKAILISIFIVPLILRIPFPFAPIHIILTELLMDLASSTIFVTESPEPDIMSRPPGRTRNFLSASIVTNIVRNGAPLAAGILAIYLVVYYRTQDVTLAQTSAFTTWLLGHILLAMNLKQERMPLVVQGFFSNRFAVSWLAGMIGLILVMTLVSPLHAYLKTTTPSLSLSLSIAGVAIATTFWIEIRKVIAWRSSR